jgi:hypothetical protein
MAQIARATLPSLVIAVNLNGTLLHPLPYPLNKPYGIFPAEEDSSIDASQSSSPKPWINLCDGERVVEVFAGFSPGPPPGVPALQMDTVHGEDQDADGYLQFLS